eukprot:m.122286 g.122286  ORF g.122286 m.122286 type:complete len:185 (+) comp37776_c0_seq4:328-882(+)
MDSCSSYEIVSSQLKDLALLSNGLYADGLAVEEETDTKTAELSDELKAEIAAHRQTRKQLEECKLKLNFALGEIDVLNKRLKETEVDLSQRCGEVEDRVAVELEEKIALATKCEGLASRCRKQEASLREKDATIGELKQMMAKEKEAHRRKVEEMVVKMQQEVYIAEMAKERERGQKRRGTSRK